MPTTSIYLPKKQYDWIHDREENLSSVVQDLLEQRMAEENGGSDE